MKKYLLLLILPFIFLNNVKADTVNALYPDSQEWLFSNCGSGTTTCTTFLKPSYIRQKYDLDFMYQRIMDVYNSEYRENYPYYIVNFVNESKPNGDLYYNRMTLSMYDNEEGVGSNYRYNQIIYTYENDTYTLEDSISDHIYVNIHNNPFLNPIGSYSTTVYSPLIIYDSNTDIINDTGNTYVVESISLTVNPGEVFTPYLQTVESQYTEVNLDNYEYVLLSLKNYNQTQAFQTNMQVKGQVGITPIYNFGQTSKDSITGVQVQDRCNLEYADYTLYPFYVLQTDLQNNVIYAVKSCSSGSSFKFNNTIFDVTYITSQNKDNPTITIGGKIYNVIPYSELPSSATENEKNNYIPGESGSSTDIGGIDSAIKSVQQKMSEIWNIFTYFTDFIGQMFSVLPTELKTVLLSAFIVAVVLGLIKIFIN